MNNKGENKMEKKINVTMNIGCTTKHGVEINPDSMINTIGRNTDCTITKTIGFYKGIRENSLKVEIYDIATDSAVDMASYFARVFMQECVALTVQNKTHFITGHLSADEFINIVDTLEK